MRLHDHALWLGGTILILAVALAALAVANQLKRVEGNEEDRRKSALFLERVESGQWQLTEADWRRGLKEQRALLDAYEAATTDLRRMMFFLAGAALLGLSLQTVALLRLRRRWRQPPSA